MNDILDLSFIQFQNVVDGIGKEINWRLKVATLAIPTDGSPPITEQDFPLYTQNKDDSGEERVFRLKDALELQNLANNQGS